MVRELHVILYQTCNNNYKSQVHAYARDWLRLISMVQHQIILSFQDRANAGYPDGRNVGKLD